MPSQGELELVAVQEESEEGDGDSALGDGVRLLTHESSASSTASITSSILEYRKFQGRTFHSEKYDTEYFAPNDEQQRESIDISHHYLLLLLDGKLSLAHLNNDLEASHQICFHRCLELTKVLDIGTGTGIWAIDFADQYPNAEVIGTDLSPIQPSWVPPNVKFDLEDATRDWSWSENSFDFVHMRYLIGAISDWGVLFKEAFRCCKPGGSIESVELFKEASKAFGRSFCEIEGDVQLLAAAGFVDLQVPVGGWAKDPKLREVGQFLRATMEADLEGYTLMAWQQILGWPKEDYQLFVMNMRKSLRDKRVHGYIRVRFINARKLEVV
ncbi:unnamed protein product [Fusarium venenatum]|uniref:Methyltransferase domain-containing protein n=1 Tax=Fusarium venenatum TaxID=56646 RepID=A0A2L2TG68_9HYPO|nr:LOW QUALITY PROTEIN: uncharacterized protein FVRRES_07853 [Fusarium venenatum]CEI63417.1 unnamed protein product [Fusarium venenatum]